MRAHRPDASGALCATTIRRTVSRLCRKLRPSLRQDGVSLAKLSVVGHIHRLGTTSPTEIAAYEGVKVQTLTRTLAELESAGWLVRERDASDRRQSRLTLTPHGRRRLADSAKASDAGLAAVIVATLTASERRLVLRACQLLDALDDALTEERQAEPRTPAAGR